MNATFNIKVSIESNKVSTSFGSEGIDDMNTTLLASILKVFNDVNARVKKQVDTFYGINGGVSGNAETSEESETAAPEANHTVTEE